VGAAGEASWLRVKPAVVHLGAAGAGEGNGIGRMLAIRHPAAVFTSV
jgi:hypothetical protein